MQGNMRVIPIRAEAIEISKQSREMFLSMLSNREQYLDEATADRWWPLTKSSVKVKA